MTMSRDPLRRRFRWLMAWLAYWVGLFVLMHVPITRYPLLTHPGSDKAIHFVLYGLLTWLGGRYQIARMDPPRGLVLVGWAIGYAIFCAFDEWLQQFVGRTASLVDWLADVMGVAVGTTVLILTHHRRSP